jgi:hypothetical protein
LQCNTINYMTTKTADSQLISVRVPTRVLSFAKNKAKSSNRTLSNYINCLLLDQLDETDYIKQDLELYNHLIKTKSNPEIVASFSPTEFSEFSESK